MNHTCLERFRSFAVSIFVDIFQALDSLLLLLDALCPLLLLDYFHPLCAEFTDDLLSEGVDVQNLPRLLLELLLQIIYQLALRCLFPEPVLVGGEAAVCTVYLLGLA